MLRVASQQGPSHALVDPQDEGHVVDLAVRPRERPATRWREHVDHQPPDAGRLAGLRLDDRDPAFGRDPPQVLLERRVGLGRTEPDSSDLHRSEDRREPDGVVGVRVRLHDEVEPPDAVAPQPVRHGVLVRAAVDEDAGVGTLHERGVALPDVDRRDRQRGGVRPGDRDQGEAPGHNPHRAGTGPPGPTSGEQPDDQAGGPDDHARARPRHDRQVRQTSRQQHEPQCGIGEREHRSGHTRVHDGEHRPPAGDDRRDRRGGHGQQVGRDRREGELPDGQQQHRGDGDLRPDRHGAEGRERTGPSPQASQHQRRDDQDTGRRRRRQHHPERPGERGVHDDEPQHGDRERVDGLAADTARLGEQDDTRHGRGTQHRRLGPGEQHEPGDRHRHGGAPSAGTHARRTAQQDHPRDHDRDVGAGDGDQVGQPDVPHRVLGGLRQQSRVAGDEPDGKTRAVTAEATGGRLAHPPPDELGGPQHGSRRRTDLDGADRVDPRDDVATTQVLVERLAVVQRPGGGAEGERGAQCGRVAVVVEDHALACPHPVQPGQPQDRPPSALVTHHGLGGDHGDRLGGAPGPGEPVDRPVIEEAAVDAGQTGEHHGDGHDAEDRAAPTDDERGESGNEHPERQGQVRAIDEHLPPDQRARDGSRRPSDGGRGGRTTVGAHVTPSAGRPAPGSASRRCPTRPAGRRPRRRVRWPRGGR